MGEGHMPLFCAARWIATEGGAKDFDLENVAALFDRELSSTK
jgi:hypothetical protein